MLNLPLLSAVIAWCVAQLIKTIITVIKFHRFDFEQFWASGGMPSSHSSTVAALSTACGYTYGFQSGIFAVACVLSLIVMYDAAGVRRAVGRQARILNKITKNLAKREPVEQSDLRELIGHTPLQVCVGGLIGIVLGFLLPYLFGVPYAN
ncbi:MAG: divergent PAP2 family protein [Clostridia bacterium]|nr:divergent PAP2 family protein [Clostridia bacterium]